MFGKLFPCFCASTKSFGDDSDDEVQTMSNIGSDGAETLSNTSTPKQQSLERRSNTLMNRSEGGGDSRRKRSLQTRSTRGASKFRRGTSSSGAEAAGGSPLKSVRKGGFSLRGGGPNGGLVTSSPQTTLSPSRSRHQQIDLRHAQSGPLTLPQFDTNSLNTFEETTDVVNWASVANDWALSRTLLSRSQLALSATQLRKEITGGWLGSAIGGTMGASRGVMSALSITNEICDLFVDRNGSTLDSNMTTVAFEKKADARTLYRFVSGLGPVPVTKKDELKFLPLCRVFRGGGPAPPRGLQFATLTALWRHEVDIPKDESNALGGSGRLLVDTAQGTITIPVMDATEELLSYYKAHLLKHGDYFRFQTPSSNFPLFTMEIGEKYMQGYLMKKDKGMYLEYHDEPHYHEPLDGDARGQYILAREVGDAPPSADGVKRKVYHLTAFKVPFGTAVYTEPWAIHDDAATIGQWRMGYTIGVAEYSTVVVFNARSQLLSFEFKEMAPSPPPSHIPSPSPLPNSRSTSSLKGLSNRSSLGPKSYRPSHLSNGGSIRPSVESSFADGSSSPASSIVWEMDGAPQSFVRFSDSHQRLDEEREGDRRVHASDGSRTIKGSGGSLRRLPSTSSTVLPPFANNSNQISFARSPSIVNKRERSSLSLASKAGRQAQEEEDGDVMGDGEKLFRLIENSPLRQVNASPGTSQAGKSSQGGVSLAGVAFDPSQSSLSQPSVSRGPSFTRNTIDGSFARQHMLHETNWDQLSPKARATSLGVPYEEDDMDEITHRLHSHLSDPSVSQKSLRYHLGSSLNIIDDAEEEMMEGIEWASNHHHHPPGSVNLECSAPSLSSSGGGGSFQGSNLSAMASSVSSGVGYSGASPPLPLQVTRLRSSLGLNANPLPLLGHKN